MRHKSTNTHLQVEGEEELVAGQDVTPPDLLDQLHALELVFALGGELLRRDGAEEERGGHEVDVGLDEGLAGL